MDFFKSNKYTGVKLLVVLLFIVILTMLRLTSQTTLWYFAILLSNLFLIIYLFIKVLFHKKEANRNLRIVQLLIAVILFIWLLIIM